MRWSIATFIHASWCNKLNKIYASHCKQNKNVHILLFRVPINLNKPGSTTYGYETKSYPPLGLLYVAGALEHAGYKVNIVDLDFENPTVKQLEDMLQLIDAIGFEVYTDNCKEVADYVSTLKKINPLIPIIIGGPHCIYFKEKSLCDIPQADIAVCNEAEVTILDIVDFLKNKKQLSEIPNIFYRNGEKILSGKPQQLIKNIDDIPFPARHLVDKYNYDRLPRGFSYKKN